MAGKKKNIKANRWFYRIIQSILRFWFEKQFNLKAHIPPEVSNLEPPYLVLPNHQGFWDPFMAAVYIRQPIYYIASDAIFRSPLLSFLLKLLGAIPKTKAQSDIDALKNIIMIRDRGDNIGIFPEGRRTWDGVTLPLVYSTSKLIRMLKVPVVTVVFKGGFFSQPRWGFHIQKGRISMDYKILFSGEELKSMKVNDIHSKLADALYFDEVEYQEEVSIEYRGKKPAEYLEQVLYTCPSCHSIGTMYSEGALFSCRNCGYELEYNLQRTFESSKNDVIFNNIRDWNIFQQENLYKYLEKPVPDGTLILHDDNLIFHTGFKSRRPRHLTSGSLDLIRDKSGDILIIKDNKDKEIESFKLPRISGLNIQNKERLEFYHDGIMYTIKGKQKRFSAYKWLNALEYLVKDKIPQFQAE